MKAFAARYATTCAVCRVSVPKGGLLKKVQEGYAHGACADAAAEAARNVGRINAGETFASGGSASAWQRKPRKNKAKYS